MASDELYQAQNSADNVSVEHLYPEEPMHESYDFGEPKMPPRIGADFQVEIPPLLAKSEYNSYVSNPANAECRIGVHHDFLVGLPIPIVWVSKEHEVVKHNEWEFLGDPKLGNIEPSKSESPTIIKNCSISENSGIDADIASYALQNGRPTGDSHGSTSQENLHIDHGEGHFLAPGLSGDAWSDFEKTTFLLGLYIFGKNFVQLKRFIESKGMGSILSLYYGKFCGSHEHRKWIPCRRMRGRSPPKQKILSVSRQQELMCRVHPKIPEESHNALVEISKTYAEGNMSLGDYFLSLKAMVGIKLLIEVVGIGKGKQNLLAVEPSRSNQGQPMRSEIPSGKAFSSLKPSEIIEFLTGDYRLSKTRSNDLFWEAVWPRLLANGWHSEQPKNSGYGTGSKNFLVFLLPGIKKFSRRRLVKGNDYFDSVSDVLNKVSKEPELLELETDEDSGNKNREENNWDSEVKLEEDDHDLSTRQRHCYLQPRTTNHNTDTMKFTVVDTSMIDSGPPYKLRELRSLPSETSGILASDGCGGDSDDGSSESSDGSDTVKANLAEVSETTYTDLTTTKSNGEILPATKYDDMNVSYQGTSTHSVDMPNMLERQVKDSNNMLEDEHSRNLPKSQLKRRLKHSSIDNIAPIAKKRRRLTACSRDERKNGLIKSSVVSRVENEIPSCYGGINELTEYMPPHLGCSQDKFSSTTSPRGSPTNSVECTPIGHTHVTEPSSENPQSRTLIDLNLPQVSPDFETDVLAEKTQRKDNEARRPDGESSPRSSSVEASSEQQPGLNIRRYGTRNRPPTARALEALASGFLTVNSRRRCKETISKKNPIPRSSRQAHGVLAPNEFSTGTATSQVEEDENVMSNSGESNMLSKFGVLSEVNDQPVTGP